MAYRSFEEFDVWKRACRLAAELRAPLYIACRIGLIPTEIQTERVQARKEISAMLQALANALKLKTY